MQHGNNIFKSVLFSCRILMILYFFASRAWRVHDSGHQRCPIGPWICKKKCRNSFLHIFPMKYWHFFLHFFTTMHRDMAACDFCWIFQYKINNVQLHISLNFIKFNKKSYVSIFVTRQAREACFLFNYFNASHTGGTSTAATIKE